MPKIAVAEAWSSSFYQSRSYAPDAFHAAKLIDGDKEFGGWLSAVGKWRDAWIEFRFARPAHLASVEICTGFIDKEQAQKRDEYYFHLRPKDVAVQFAGPGRPEAALVLEDIKEPQVFALESGGLVTGALLIVRTVYDASPQGAIKPFDVVGLRHVEWQDR